MKKLEGMPICTSLLETEMEKVYSSGKVNSKWYFANVYRDKPLRVSQKVYIPIHEHPRFNFIGKILGPEGKTLRKLQKETKCRMLIQGRGSMKDSQNEEELRNSGDPRYAHLHRDLHVDVSTIASPSEAYARVAYALVEIRKYLVPDANDEIRKEQIGELKSKGITSKSVQKPQISTGTSQNKIFTIFSKTKNLINETDGKLKMTIFSKFFLMPTHLQRITL